MHFPYLDAAVGNSSQLVEISRLDARGGAILTRKNVGTFFVAPLALPLPDAQAWTAQQPTDAAPCAMVNGTRNCSTRDEFDHLSA